MLQEFLELDKIETIEYKEKLRKEDEKFQNFQDKEQHKRRVRDKMIQVMKDDINFEGRVLKR